MRLGIIGLGQMGKAIAKGLLKTGALSPADLIACGRDQNKLNFNCKELGIRAEMNPASLVRLSDWILLGVKPYQAETVLLALKEELKGKVLLSVLAGKSEAELRESLDPSTEVLCAIPNTPCEVGKGIWILRPSESLSPKNEELFRQIFGRIGQIEKMEGAAADAAGSIAGCGPAFAAMFLEALGDAGVRGGLPRRDSYRIAAAMMGGLAELYLESGTHPAVLKDQVCSPGGTTIRGVQALDASGFRAAVAAAIRAVQEE